MDGRAASAPAVKQKTGIVKLISDGANHECEDECVAIAHDVHVLPHDLLPEDIERLFPKVCFDGSTLYDEEDNHDMSDPVPELQARAKQALRARRVAKKGNRVQNPLRPKHLLSSTSRTQSAFDMNPVAFRTGFPDSLT